jgi:hypothetical protein
VIETPVAKHELPFEPEPLSEALNEPTGPVDPVPQEATAAPVPTELPAPDSPSSDRAPLGFAPVTEKPKRKRRTKAEIAAAAAAEAAAKEAKAKAEVDSLSAITAHVPPVVTPASVLAADEATAVEASADATPFLDGELEKEFDEIARLSGQLPRLEVSERLTALRRSLATAATLVAKAATPTLSPETVTVTGPPGTAIPVRPETSLKVPPVDVPPLAVPLETPARPRRRFLGIDPGLTGHQVVLDEDLKTIVSSEPCPTLGKGTSKGKSTRKVHDVAKIIEEVKGYKVLGVESVLLEAQQPFPKIGSIANFVKGASKGIWETALLSFGISFDTERPITWKKAMGISGGAPNEVKRRAIAKAQRLFPGVDLRADPDNPRSKKLSSDKAEALLLSLYVARTQLGQGVGTPGWKEAESKDSLLPGEKVDFKTRTLVPDPAPAAQTDDQAKRAALAELTARVSRGSSSPAAVKPKRKRRTKAEMELARKTESATISPVTGKPKRKRRTKAEMEEARATETALSSEKPKRTRRTKAEMQAARAAEAASKKTKNGKDW